MLFKKLICATLLTIFLSTLVNAQNNQTEGVQNCEVILKKEIFANYAFPFDIPFNIIGDIPKNAFKITYSYQIKDQNKKSWKDWMNLPNIEIGQYHTDSYTLDGDKFSLYCPGMHPNIQYTFKFEIYRKAVIDEKEIAELKAKLASEFNTFSKQYEKTGFDEGYINLLNSNLNAVFQKQLNIESGNIDIKSKNNPSQTYTLNVRDNSVLKPQFEKFMTANENIFKAQKDLFGTGKYDSTFMNAIEEIDDLLLKDINEILSGKLKLNTLSFEYLKLPFAPSLPEFRNFTLLDGLKILHKILLPKQNIEVFLVGKRKIVNQELEVSDKIEYQSLYFINALLTNLASGVIKDTIERKEMTRFTSLKNLIDTQIYIRYFSDIKLLDNAKKDREELETNFPDLTTNVVLKDAISLEAISVADVVSDKTPYISLEGGVSYSSLFRSALTYTGANFYLSPVNKKAPLKTFKGWNLFKKMFCFNISVGNFMGARPLNTYSFLGDNSKQDLLIGCGLRLGRIIKVNMHMLPYRTTNNNTLAPNKVLEATVAFSVGLDVNLLKALGNISGKLGITD